MTQRSSDGFGARLSRLRRMNGLSAQQLSDATGGEITRAVIANIESGRKKDVSVDQTIALALGLGVNPLALMLPLDEPDDFYDFKGQDGEPHDTIATIALRFRDELVGLRDRPTQRSSPADVTTRATMWNTLLLVKSREHLAKLAASGDTDYIAEEEKSLRQIEQTLRDLGVTLRGDK